MSKLGREMKGKGFQCLEAIHFNWAVSMMRRSLNLNHSNQKSRIFSRGYFSAKNILDRQQTIKLLKIVLQVIDKF